MHTVVYLWLLVSRVLPRHEFVSSGVWLFPGFGTSAQRAHDILGLQTLPDFISLPIEVAQADLLEQNISEAKFGRFGNITDFG